MTSYRLSGSGDDATRFLLDYLMREDRVGGAFVLTEVAPGHYSHALVTNRGLLPKVAATVPLMPANGGRMAARLTVPEPPEAPVAVVLRPCELRSLVELGKLEQARLDGLLLISHVCDGVLPTRAAGEDFPAKRKRYTEASVSGEVWGELRDTCRVCEQFVPEGADVVLSRACSEGSDECLVLAATARGEEFLAGLEGGPTEGELDVGRIGALRQRRRELKADVFGQFDSNEFGIEGLVRVFGRCINCHACSKACPVCYCDSCHFETSDSEYESGAFGQELDRRGGMRLPFDTVYYQVGRMLHVSMSCVGCGMCSDACPVDIPVAILFAKLADRVQSMFDYTAGRDREEKIPTGTYREDELPKVGE